MVGHYQVYSLLSNDKIEYRNDSDVEDSDVDDSD